MQTLPGLVDPVEKRAGEETEMLDSLNDWVKVEDQEPPKDGNPFLAIIGYPWAVMLAWSSHDEQFVWPQLQACPMEGGGDDVYFENEWINEKELVAWQPLPEVGEQFLPVRKQMSAKLEQEDSK